MTNYCGWLTESYPFETG